MAVIRRIVCRNCYPPYNLLKYAIRGPNNLPKTTYLRDPPDNTNFFASVGRTEDYPLSQERILASRILHGSHPECVFECENSYSD